MGAEPAPPRGRSSAMKRTILWFAAAVVVAAVVGGGYWAMACPCGGIPGSVLRGEVHREPVQDWRFANDVLLCQIEINTGWLPHSVNLNCMATPSGDLFLSCSAGTRKYWCQQVGADHQARLRLNGTARRSSSASAFSGECRPPSGWFCETPRASRSGHRLQS